MYTTTIVPNMDIVHHLYRRRNVIWVKLGIGSIWETGFYIEPLATHIEPVVRYQKLSAQYRNQGRYM